MVLSRRIRQSGSARCVANAAVDMDNSSVKAATTVPYGAVTRAVSDPA